MRLTLQEVVELHGTEKQKNCLVEGKKWRKESDDALMKTLDQIYESIDIEGRGKNKTFIFGAEKDTKSARKDNRKNNGKKVPYEREINSLVLDFVLNNCQNNFTTMSLSSWLVKTKLVDWNIINAFNNKKLMKRDLGLLMDKYGEKFTSKSDIIMLEHFITTELDKLKRNLASVFHKLAENKIIIHRVDRIGCTLDDERKVLTDEEITKVANVRKNLCEKHNVSLKDVRYKSYNDSVKAFKDEYKEELESMGFKYIYESHGCVVQASEKMIREYLDKLIEKNELVICYGLSESDLIRMVDDFKTIYTDRSLELAGNRQMNKDNTSDHRYIKQLKALEDYLPMWEVLLIFYGLTNYKEQKVEIFD